jgi:cyclopropane-fatty-acyl-phospholipid synthase
MSSAKKVVQNLLSLADIEVNGSRPFDIQVHDERFYKSILTQRELGMGESYIDGWWTTKRLDEVVERLLSAGVREKLKITPQLATVVAWSVIKNKQTVSKARRNAEHHYNIGNDLYEQMLGKRMIYSCAYWKNATNLDDAQEAKLDLICQKLQLKSGMTLLDIGCGWGGFSEYAARKYKVSVTGITPAREQFELAQKRIAGLPVKILQQDYREVKGKYDRIVSIGMLEHVGHKNLGEFFKRCHRMLNDGGMMLHHTVGNNRSTVTLNPWTDKYIFPGAVVPSLTQISKATEKLLIVEDLQNFGPYYDKTLLAWYKNFVSNYPKLKDRYDERFYRMWEFYLLTSAGYFRARQLQLWQIVMRKIETSQTYIAPR